MKKYKLPPCSIYDIPAIETWLSDMALKGWKLKKAGIRFFCFEKKAPSEICCRLEPITDNSKIPDLETQDFYANAGWEYVTTADNLFYIWRSISPDPCELHSDPIIQSTAYEQVCRQLIKNAAVMTLAAMTVLIITICGFAFSKRPVHLLLASPFIVLLVLTEFMFTLTAILQAVRIVRLKHMLTAGIAAIHSKNYKKGFWLRCSIRCLYGVFSFVIFTTAVYTLISVKCSSISEFHTSLPFLPLDVIEQNPDFSWHKDSLTRNGADSFSNAEYSWSPLVPVHYDIYQQGEPYSICQDPASPAIAVSPSARTEYFQLLFPALAAPLFHEMTDVYIDQKLDPITRDFSYPGLDRVVTAKTDSRTQLFALRGCQVIYINYYGNADLTERLKLLTTILERV